MVLKERYLSPKVEKTFEGLEEDFEDEEVKIRYNVEDGEYAFEAKVNSEEGITAEVRYNTVGEYNHGRASVIVRRDDETLIDDSQAFRIDEVPAPKGEDVMAFRTLNYASKLRNALRDTITLANEFTDSEELFNYRKIVSNSCMMENKDRATLDLIRSTESELTESLDTLPVPLETLGDEYTSNTASTREDEELRSIINDSPESKKWRALGEEISSGERSVESIEEIIRELNNSRIRITDMSF